MKKERREEISTTYVTGVEMSTTTWPGTPGPLLPPHIYVLRDSNSQCFMWIKENANGECEIETKRKVVIRNA